MTLLLRALCDEIFDHFPLFDENFWILAKCHARTFRLADTPHCHSTKWLWAVDDKLYSKMGKGRGPTLLLSN